MPDEQIVAQGVKRLRLENDTHIIQQNEQLMHRLPEVQDDEKGQQVADVDYHCVNAFLRDLHNSRVIRRKTREAQMHSGNYALLALPNPQEQQEMYYNTVEEAKGLGEHPYDNGYYPHFPDDDEL